MNSAELVKKCVQSPCRTMTAPSSDWRREVLYFKLAATVRLPILVWHPFEFLDETYPAQTRGMGLLYGENCMILASTVFDWSTRVTDGRTDGFAIAYSALSMLSRANKTLNSTAEAKYHNTYIRDRWLTNSALRNSILKYCITHTDHMLLSCCYLVL